MNTEPEKKQKVLTEVWGDTVNIKELAISIILGVIFTMVFYLIGRKIFMSMGTIEENLAKGYALFIGIAGCFIAAVISAKSFRPLKMRRGFLNCKKSVRDLLNLQKILTKAIF